MLLLRFLEEEMAWNGKTVIIFEQPIGNKKNWTLEQEVINCPLSEHSKTQIGRSNEATFWRSLFDSIPDLL